MIRVMSVSMSFRNLAGCTDPTLSKNGRLIELA
jgi:hypothetical protein